MDIGVYTDLPREEYDAIDAMNHSRLSAGTKSLAHLKAQLAGRDDRPESAALAFGRAYHCLVLEPEVFERTYAQAPEGANVDGSASRASKDGRQAWADWEEQHPGMEAVAPRDWHVLHAMRDVITDHPAASRLLALPADNEVTCVWDDLDTQVRCKGRFDRMTRDWETIIDLKTTECAAPHVFDRSLYEYGYHRQAAFYCDGLHSVSGAAYPGFYIVAQEKYKPYLVSVFLIDEDAIDYGRYQYQRILAAYAESMLTGEWPGYATEVQPLGLPRWVRWKAAQELEAANAAQ